MISGRGYGMFVVMGVYLFFFVMLSLFGPTSGRIAEIMAIIVALTLATSISFFIAKWLNRDGSRHTVYDMRLEKAVLAFGVVLVSLALLMLHAEFKD